jgi:cell wall-associated NlpC family hydrolase
MPPSFAALAAVVVGVVVLPAQALAASPSSTAAGGMTAKQAPAPPAEVPGEHASLTVSGLAVPPASAPQAVKDVIAAGNRIARKPYRYGGGHGRWLDSGYDCSGSVSFALRGGALLRSPLDSSGFMRWGQRGRGTWITIRSNPGHAYMIVAGLRFDTSARRVGGSRWTDQMRSARGYRGTHPAGL